MSVMKCPYCGGEYEFSYDSGYDCKFCGAKGDPDAIADTVVERLNLANSRRMENYDFEGSLEMCRSILADYPDNRQANWCALLAQYKVIYLKNAENKYAPTFIDPDCPQPITESEYYSRLNVVYRHSADEIEDMRKYVVRESKKIPDYDVFISYKQHVGNSSAETPEAEWAEEFYNALTKKYGKLNVFFDKQSLGVSNAGWEPHIYAALRSAKFMVVFGSSVENINSVWVKNEWKRFAAYQRAGENKTIVVAGVNISPAELPDNALRAGQMISLEDKDWQKKLLKRAYTACESSGVSDDVPHVLDMANTYIRNKEFSNAKKQYERVCAVDPKNTKAYWGLLKCRLKALDDYDIIRGGRKLSEFEEFNAALRYADDEERARILNVQKRCLSKDFSGESRPNYNCWRQKTKPRRVAVGVILPVLIAAILCVSAVLGVSYYQKSVVQETVALIDAIGVVTLDSDDAIKTAEKSYDELSAKLKKKVSNAGKLADARAVYDVMYAISRIGVVSFESGEAIATAENAYNALTQEQKDSVTNYETLHYGGSLYRLSVQIRDLECTAQVSKEVITDSVTVMGGDFFALTADIDRTEITGMSLPVLTEIEGDTLATVFPNLTTLKYDLTGAAVSAFTFVPDYFDYIISGSTDIQYTTEFTARQGNKLNVTFENFKLAAGGIALNFSAVASVTVGFGGECLFAGGDGGAGISGNDVEIFVNSDSSVNITGGNGKDGATGAAGIEANSLTIGGAQAQNAKLRIRGGNGSDAEKAVGGDGGAGISVGTLKISTSAVVNIYGGIGGTGGTGEGGNSGYSVGNNANGRDGYEGHAGYTGGAGGSAVVCANMTVNASPSVSLSGGQGGVGGTGGLGGTGGTGGKGSGDGKTPGAVGGAGGRGGMGGVGGTGGNCIVCSGTIKFVNSLLGLRTGKGGEGGIGGKGGYGGIGGEGAGSNSLGETAGRGGKGGVGGAGGTGGTGGNCGAGMTYGDISKDVDSKVALIVESGGNGGRGGNGGVGGTGGKGGTKHTFASKPGPGGAGGNGGSGGYGGGIGGQTLDESRDWYDSINYNHNAVPGTSGGNGSGGAVGATGSRD